MNGKNAHAKRCILLCINIQKTQTACQKRWWGQTLSCPLLVFLGGNCPRRWSQWFRQDPTTQTANKALCSKMQCRLFSTGLKDARSHFTSFCKNEGTDLLIFFRWSGSENKAEEGDAITEARAWLVGKQKIKILIKFPLWSQENVYPPETQPNYACPL